MKGLQLFQKKSIDDILSNAETHHTDGHKLKRNLSVYDLTAFGIAAIIGAGIFSTIGTAATTGGPAISLLFVFTAVACGFSAMCYARFASILPISGSAYTYAYASFGELLAWIIGWDLIMEYSIGNIAVAISWSGYFNSFLSGFGLHLPEYLTTDWVTAHKGFEAAITQFPNVSDIAINLSGAAKNAYLAWANAPQLFGIRIILDIPALMIVLFITYLVYIGIKESKTANNIMVVLKIGILLVVIAIGAFFIKTVNWSPFAPNGAGGVMKGVSAVFFAYIGFDAMTTTSEECKNPQRDLPRSIIFSLLITTVLYVVISLVITGMVSYTELGVSDPLAYIFAKLDMPWISGLIGLGAIIAMASVLLVFQLGQPRIWMSMSRDGLLPARFSKLHPKYKTPAFSTLITGLLVGIPVLFMNMTEVTDLTSIGTLFALVLVSGGALALDHKDRKNNTEQRKGFKIPYYNSRYFLPPILILSIAAVLYFNYDGVMNYFNLTDKAHPELSQWKVFSEKIPMILFVIITLVLSYFSLVKKFSLIPVLGLLSNLGLMTQLGITNWLRFLIWLGVGLVIYFTYSMRHSKLRRQASGDSYQ
jgi:amino acid transporter